MIPDQEGGERVPVDHGVSKPLNWPGTSWDGRPLIDNDLFVTVCDTALLVTRELVLFDQLKKSGLNIIALATLRKIKGSFCTVGLKWTCIHAHSTTSNLMIPM